MCCANQPNDSGMSFIWIETTAVRAVHDTQLAEHGGLSGVRDAGLLQSALACPQNLLTADDLSCVTAVLALAAGGIDEATFAAWLRTHLAARRNAISPAPTFCMTL